MNMLKYSDLTGNDEFHLGKERVIAGSALVTITQRLDDFRDIRKFLALYGGKR